MILHSLLKDLDHEKAGDGNCSECPLVNLNLLD